MAETTRRSEEIDAILAPLSPQFREALERLRHTIATAAPDAVEGISYGAPAFRYRGRPLVSFNAAKHHLALYVMSPAVMDSFAAELEGLDTTKGAIRFQPERPLPDELVAALVRARMAETDAAAERKR